jgi:molecular chaperone GrpE
MEKEEIKNKEQNNTEEVIKDKSEIKNSEEKEVKKQQTPEEKIKDLEDKVTRIYADMENQRRRYEKEKEEAFEYGGFSFARETLNLIDNLERSKVALQNDNELKNTEALKKIIEHLEIINKDMLSILKKNNIEVIKSINEKLDPNFHQAMMEVEDDAKDPGTIVQEIQKGFMMKDRLLRPALVCVSKKTQKSTENLEKNDQKEVNNDKK